MRLRVELETVEGGRFTVRSWGADVDDSGVFLRRLKLLAGDDVVLSLPLGLDEYPDDDEDDDE